MRLFVIGILLICACVCTIDLRAQVSFIPNQNQWEQEVLFAADIQGGRAFFLDRTIRYAYYSAEDVERAHLLQVDSNLNILNDNIRCFAYQTEFAGAQMPVVSGAQRRNYNVNYFIGNDRSQWASDVPVYAGLYYSEIYKGIDVHYYSQSDQLKYDFILSPHADVSQVRIKYSGLKSISLSDGTLVLDLGFMQITEVIPSSYQLRNGVKEEVRCRFALAGNEVHFVFPDGYDPSLPLVIDPSVIAATASGGIGISAGLCATYDGYGNIYSAGNAFSTGYPVDLGAFDTSFYAAADLAVSKYNPDGSTLLYCTYIGGIAADFPQSIIVFNNALYIYGMTYSFDFPMTAQGYDQALSGITDIYVCCLNNTGTALIASTYIGGTWGDGYNNVAPYYSDRLRGEIKVASNGDVLVASSCLSPNFPTTAGAYRTTSIGGQEAVVFRMDATLTTLIWATYLGSSVHDAGLGILESLDGSIYVCGATNNGPNTPFPTVPGCYKTTPQGGTDGFVARLNSSGTTLMAGTMFGANGTDMAHFIDVDEDGSIYICGTSRQNTPVTSDVFIVPGGEVYVAKLDAGLTTLAFCTELGAGGSSSVVITQPSSPGPPPVGGPSPLRPNNNAVTAFMVDECKRMYIGAYCGPTPWPTTGDAAYQFSQENQFCVLVLEEDAVSLVYSTMHPGVHIDGGHGRFTKKGVLYQAACVADGENFPSTPWAYSAGGVATNYDNSVFVVDAYVEITVENAILPNVFTPNGDGINDEYDPQLFKPRSYEIWIYNRWGMEVFHSTSADVKWDGTTTSGSPCEQGVYFVAVKYGYCDEPILKNGFVHLFR